MKIIKVELSDQECFDIITNAVETGAIKYWVDDYTRPVKIWRDEKLNITKAVIELQEDDEHNGQHVFTITPKIIRRGIVVCLNHGYIQIDNPSDPDFDSADSDNIIQCGLFGTIVYG